MKRSGIEGYPSFQANSLFRRDGDGDEVSCPRQLEQVLYPNRESVKEVLGNAEPESLSDLFSEYFDNCERVTSLCLLLCRRIHPARSLYRIVDVYGDDPRSFQGDLDLAFDEFLKFDSFVNPEFNDVRCWFFELKKQLECRLRELRNKVPLVSVATASCLPICSLHKPTKWGRSEIAQLDAAVKGAYIIYNDIDTLDRLIARLDSGVESDKHLVRIGLDMGKDMQLMYEVVKQLQGSHLNFMNQLRDLEEHICACFNAVNKGRFLLFRELSPH